MNYLLLNKRDRVVQVKSTYSCLADAKAPKILTLLLFLELYCKDLQGTEENRRKDLKNAAIWINFIKDF